MKYYGIYDLLEKSLTLPNCAIYYYLLPNRFKTCGFLEDLPKYNNLQEILLGTYYFNKIGRERWHWHTKIIVKEN